MPDRHHHPAICRAFILAADRTHAVRTMSCDLQWERCGTSGGQPIYRSADGERVTVIDRIDQLRGHRGSRLYLGYGYEEVEDWEIMHDFLMAWGLVLVDVSAPLARYRAMEAQRHGV